MSGQWDAIEKAVAVLGQHQRSSIPAWQTCTCGWEGPRDDPSADVRETAYLTHVAEMLEADGLLA